MKKFVVYMSVLVAMSFIMSGCKHIDGEGTPTAKTTNTYVVVVGMENSRFAGECPGAGYDADRMYKLLSQYTPNAVLLRDSNATKANVVNALRNAISKAGDGLVIFSYSGHGGSEPFPDTGIEETDGHDEFLCLWDTYMRDNEIWNIINKSSGRIFLLFDCCHSETMMRNPMFKIVPPLSFDHTITENCKFSMLCWSGCPDNTYSYGASNGGQFTNALLRHFNASKTYEYLWNEIKNDKTLRAYENPQSTVLGNGFAAKPIFR
jgi:hypothetical protein